MLWEITPGRPSHNQPDAQPLGTTSSDWRGHDVLVSAQQPVCVPLRKGERVDHFETKRKRTDGTLIDISLTISPIKDPSGTTKIARDITEQICNQQELRQANDSLICPNERRPQRNHPRDRGKQLLDTEQYWRSTFFTGKRLKIVVVYLKIELRSWRFPLAQAGSHILAGSHDFSNVWTFRGGPARIRRDPSGERASPGPWRGARSGEIPW